MTAALVYAIARHLWAAVVAIGKPGVIRTVDWVALASAELILLLVALHLPEMFKVRTLRLVGVATAANALIIFAPLPDVIAVFDGFVPELMIFSLAAGIAAMALVFLALSQWSCRYRTDGQGSNRVRQDVHNEWILPLAIIIIALVVLPLWFVEGGTPPLLNLLTGTQSLDLAASRQAALSNLSSAPLRFMIGVLRNLLLMFAAGWFVASAATTPKAAWRRRSTAELVAMSIAALGVLFALWTTERAVVGELLAVCGMALIAVNRKEISVKLIGALVVVAGLFPFAVGFVSGAGNASEVLIGLRRRAFYLPAEVMTRYFIEFPAYHDYLHGASIPKISYVTGGETFNLSTWIYQRYYQRGLGYIGNANGSFLGTGWANFGLLGVVLWCVAAAVMLVVIDRAIDRVPRRSGAALRGLGVIMAVLTTSSDIFRNILGFLPGYLDLVVLVLVISWITRRRTFRRCATTQVGHKASPSTAEPASTQPEPSALD